jgi:hypothetical protein
MLSENEGYGIYRNTETGGIYRVHMTLRKYEADAAQVNMGAESLEFVPYVYAKTTKKGKTGAVNTTASRAKAESIEKKFRLQFASKPTKLLAVAS